MYLRSRDVVSCTMSRLYVPCPEMLYHEGLTYTFMFSIISVEIGTSIESLMDPTLSTP